MPLSNMAAAFPPGSLIGLWFWLKNSEEAVYSVNDFETENYY